MFSSILQYLVYMIREDGSDNMMKNEAAGLRMILRIPEVRLAYINRKKDLILLCSLGKRRDRDKRYHFQLRRGLGMYELEKELEGWGVLCQLNDFVLYFEAERSELMGMCLQVFPMDVEEHIIG
jgi:hypothetical protein